MNLQLPARGEGVGGAAPPGGPGRPRGRPGRPGEGRGPQWGAPALRGAGGGSHRARFGAPSKVHRHGTQVRLLTVLCFYHIIFLASLMFCFLFANLLLVFYIPRKTRHSESNIWVWSSHFLCFSYLYDSSLVLLRRFTGVAIVWKYLLVTQVPTYLWNNIYLFFKWN